jgi:esterase/lipase superfamily enzyme
MNIEYHRFWSSHLSQNMELKNFGSHGKPVLVFPSMAGRFYEFEDFGMIEAVKDLIDLGSYQFFTVDSIDQQSWLNENISPGVRARRHEDYDRYITREVVPFIFQRCGNNMKLLTTGVSMGGYHSGNFFFRHPDIFDSLISLSGVFQLRRFIGDYMDENVYFNSPLLYLPELTDSWYLHQYQQSSIIICVGQGEWEKEMLEDIHKLQAILENKQIPAWVDYWGYDVSHDWPWWRKQLPYFLKRLKEK